MSKTTDELVEKYLAAESTLAEEEELFNTRESQAGMEEWSTYVKQKRKKAPTDLTDSILAAIQTKKRRSQRFLLSFAGVAASIALLLAIFTYTTSKGIDYDQKQAVLNEALSMFTEEKHTPIHKNIIYEDDMVIIYMASN